MAPPAKRRKRAIVDDDSDDDDNNIKNNSGSQNLLKRFLLSSPDKSATSPDKKPSITTESPSRPASASASPSPIRKRATRAGSKPARSPSTSPLKPRTRAAAAKRKADDSKDAAAARSADLPTLFSRQAQRNSQSAAARGTISSAASSTSSLSLGTGASGSSYHLSAGGRRSQLDDIISDPISEQNGESNGGDDDDDDDDIPLMYSASTAAASSLVERAQAAQKRFAGSSKAGSGAASQGGSGVMGAAAGGQRFLRAARSSKASSSTGGQNGDDDSRPWSERFAPVSLDELAVHRRKVQDVRRWLEDVFAGRARQRLLVLKGPAGAGKTTTVRLLARDMRCEVLEWRNPASSFGVPGHAYQSAAAQFEEFLGRGGKFGQLDVESDDAATPPPMGPPPPAPAANAGKRLMLVEEFPNTFMRSSAGLMGFRDAVLQFLAANVPPPGLAFTSEPATPVVMVISETLLTTTSASADSFTAHRLLGPEILKHPGTSVIEFKPIAPTFLTKALELVVQKEARKSGRRRTPGPRVLQRLGEVGDIRNAISSLEFLCAKGDAEADWGAKVAFTKPKRASKDAPPLTKGEQDSLELVSQREATLGIFHAVGKVVYNKRSDFPPDSVEAEAEAALPDYMSHLARPKRSEVAVDALIDEIGTDTHTFISALHENYPLSCEQTSPQDPNSPIDYINGCLDYLSDSDLLYPSWDVFFGGGRGAHSYGGGGALSNGYMGKDSGSHMLRQDEMAFQVAVRGLLFSLPSPVRRQAHPGGRGNDAFKMYYPTYLKLWRSKEELEALVDMWATKLLKGEDCGPGPPQSGRAQAFVTDGAAAFRKAAGANTPITNGFPGAGGNKPKPDAQQHRSTRPPPPLPLLSLGSAARKELLLERLPYTAHVARGRRQFSFFGGSMRMRDLDQMVSFRGIGALGAGEDEGEEAVEYEAAAQISGVAAGGAAAPLGESSWATDRPVTVEEDGVRAPRKRWGGLGAILSGRAGKKGGEEEEEDSGLLMQGLVISDDDIEDD